MQDARVFTTIDLKNGFFHVPIEKSSRKYTSFVTHHGQFEFCVVPFGLCNSPSIFQRFINYVFRALAKQHHVLAYIYDLIIPAKDEEEGLEKMKLVLMTASEYGLEPNFQKCQFLKKKDTFLGHIVEDGTVRPSDEKIMAVKMFPMPKKTKEVQTFLGLSGYFRKFVPQYSLIAKPLSDLLKSDAFCFHS